MTSLSVSDDGKGFLLNGKEFRVLSGAMHYFRVVPEYWKDRLIKMKECGLNCVETYVPWNAHEGIQGQYDFDGILDLRKYVKLAQEVGLYVILRPGPYICAEWDWGGLPSWLLRDPNMKVRSSYIPYLDAVDKWLSALFPQFVDLQKHLGGPIIAVQIENEYGSYGDDYQYIEHLRQLFLNLGIKELLFTSDNPLGIHRGIVGDGKQVIPTINFQYLTHGQMVHNYVTRIKSINTPLFVMEFWSGWFDHWGESHHTWSHSELARVLEWILKSGGSVNFYMFHGGTNFGFMNGANENQGAVSSLAVEPYQADVTSYDYDAPISENGDLTAKYYKIKELLAPYNTTNNNTLTGKAVVSQDLPPRGNYGSVAIDKVLSFDKLLSLVEPIESENLLSMEQLDINQCSGQGYGYIVYEKVLHNHGYALTITLLSTARVMVLSDNDCVYGPTVSSCDHAIQADLLPPKGGEDSPEPRTVRILVENMGRVNYANFAHAPFNQQKKGLKDVLLDWVQLKDWKIYPLEFKAEFVKRLYTVDASTPAVDTTSPALPMPTVSVATLHINPTDTSDEKSPAIGDTYVDMQQWTRGAVFVNGHNLGRYNKEGPQQALYCPAPLLHQRDNQIIVFDMEHGVSEVSFCSEPKLGAPVAHNPGGCWYERALVGLTRWSLYLGGPLVNPLLRWYMHK